MLYDGALKFSRQAIDSIEAGAIESGFDSLMRAQKIVLELSTSLNHQIAPDLCDKLAALYTYIYRLLVDANTQRRTQPVEEAIQLLEYEKETWQMLMQKLADEGGPARQQGVAGAQQTAISSLSRSA
jgi:flagellar protein FliS